MCVQAGHCCCPGGPPTSSDSCTSFYHETNDCQKPPRSYSQFQISTNITTIIITLVSTISPSHEESVLTAVQLLRIKVILGQSIYQVIIILILHFLSHTVLAFQVTPVLNREWDISLEALSLASIPLDPLIQCIPTPAFEHTFIRLKIMRSDEDLPATKPIKNSERATLLRTVGIRDTGSPVIRPSGVTRHECVSGPISHST